MYYDSQQCFSNMYLFASLDYLSVSRLQKKPFNAKTEHVGTEWVHRK